MNGAFVPGSGTVLASLRDLAGVAGSFLISDQEGVLARDMPPIFGDDLLAEVGPRLLRLVDTFAGDGSEVHSFLVRYREYVLFLRSNKRGLLCVLSEPEVNMPALKMGANLALRRLGTLIAAREAQGAPLVAPSATGPAPRTAPPPAASPPPSAGFGAFGPTAPAPAPSAPHPTVERPLPDYTAIGAPSITGVHNMPRPGRPAIQWRGGTIKPADPKPRGQD